MAMPLTTTQCLFVVVFVFMVLGLWRGWRRELITLAFVLFATFLVLPHASGGKSPIATVSPFVGPFWSLLIVTLLGALSYVIGNRAFPRPKKPAERGWGLLVGIVTGGFLVFFLSHVLTFAAH